ncbi:MAG: phytanoyl-CoA dioxygenase family protein [Acidobacteria bacterium]|nr:phytanoyl-CoA dioxygenase family protein [Acidobacteriota bacterium]
MTMAAHQARFAEDGFEIVRGLLTAADLQHIGDGFARFVRDIAPTLSRAEAMYEDYDDPATFKQSGQLHREPALDRYRHEGPIRELAERLIGPVIPQHVEYFAKPVRGSTPTPPHQDGFYFCLEPNTACTVWVPLDPADEENGTLHYAPGSHRLGVLPHNASHILGFSQGLAETAPAMIPCPVSPGDALVHHSLTVHSAGANRSGRPRRVIAFVFFGAHTRRDPAAWERYQAALRQQHEALKVTPPEAT